jgi:hypothetical protein
VLQVRHFLQAEGAPRGARYEQLAGGRPVAEATWAAPRIAVSPFHRDSGQPTCHRLAVVLLAEATTTTAAIGAVALVIGAAVGGLGTWYQTRHKIKEIMVAEALRRESEHLQNARAHTDEVYVPLGVALAQLQDAFLLMRDGADEGGASERFREAIGAFREAMDELTRSGRHLFLTHDLSARIRDFGAFLQASRTAEETRTSIVVRAFGAEWKNAAGGIVAAAASSAAAILTPIGSLVPVLGIGTIEVGDTVAAPIASREFARRFQRDVAAIERSIRDVTLGAS